MLSREDKYRSTIIDRIIKSLGNGLTSGVYLRTTIDDSGTNEVVISTDPSNATITIANTDGSASRTFDYSSGITWSEFNSLFTSTDSTDNVEVNGTSITISGVKVRDEPGNVTPINWGSFTNITLSNCTFDIKRIDGAFSKSGPISISIDNTNDFSNVYSFDHLFDGCNTLTSIVFNPIHNGMFTANWMLANLSRELKSEENATYTNYAGDNITYNRYWIEKVDITLLDFTNCHSALDLLDGTDNISSITLSTNDYDKQSVGTLLTLGNYNWPISPIYSKKSNNVITFEIHCVCSSFDFISSLVKTAIDDQTESYNINLNINNMTIFRYANETGIGDNRYYEDLENRIEFSTDHANGFTDVFESIAMSLNNCNIYCGLFGFTTNHFYPITSLSISNCYFGPSGLLGSFQFMSLCNSLSITNCDTSDVVQLRSAFGRFYSLEKLDLSQLNLENVETIKYMCYCEPNITWYDSETKEDKTLTSSLTEVRLPSRMPKLRSMQLAFNNCILLTTVILPSTLPSLSGYSDLINDKLLEEIPGTNPVQYQYNTTKYSTTKIKVILDENYGFTTELVNITIAEGDFYTGLFGTFTNCSSLRNIKLPPMNALRQMYNTFKGCICLEKVEFEDMNSLEIIQDIFDVCVALKSVKFKSCANLEYIYDMFTSVSTLEELEMLNCPNVSRFVNLVPSSVKRLKLEGFNKIVRNYDTETGTPQIITQEDQITPQIIGGPGSTVYSNYAIFQHTDDGYTNLEEIELNGFNMISILSNVFVDYKNYNRITDSKFPRLRNVRLIGFNQCEICSNLMPNTPSIETVYMEGFYNLNTLYAAFANTSTIREITILLSDNLSDESTNLNLRYLCERSNGIEKLILRGKRYIYIDDTEIPSYSFMRYCNAMRYLDISGIRIKESDYTRVEDDTTITNITKGILIQVVDNTNTPYGWTFQPFHLTTLTVPNLFISASVNENGDIVPVVDNTVPIAYERYKKAIVSSIDSTTTMTCKLSIMGRFFIRQFVEDIPPLNWTVQNLVFDGKAYGNFNNKDNEDVTITVEVDDTSIYSVGDEYSGTGTEVLSVNGIEKYRQEITYPCSIYKDRPNVIWIIGTKDRYSVNIEEYGFSFVNYTSFPNLYPPSQGSITKYSQIISSYSGAL